MGHGTGWARVEAKMQNVFFVIVSHDSDTQPEQFVFFVCDENGSTAGYRLRSRMVVFCPPEVFKRHILHPEMSFGCAICAPLALENRQISFLGSFGRLACPTESSPHSPPDPCLSHDAGAVDRIHSTPMRDLSR